MSITPVRTYSRKRFMPTTASSSSAWDSLPSTDVSPKTSPKSSQELLSSQENLMDDIWDNSNKAFQLDLTSKDDVANNDDFFSFGKEEQKSKKRRGNSSLKPPAKKKKPSPSKMQEIASKKSTLERNEEVDKSYLQDDLDYIMDGLNLKQPLLVRQASAFGLAKLCKSRSAALGQFLRVEGLLKPLFNDLLGKSDDSDSTTLTDETMALCSAAILFFLFKESVNAEYVTPNCLELLLLLATWEPNKNKSKTTIQKGKTDTKTKAMNLLNDGSISGSVEIRTISFFTISAMINVLGGTQLDHLKQQLGELGILQQVLQEINIRMESYQKLSKKKYIDYDDLSQQCKELRTLFNLIDQATFINPINREIVSSQELIGSLLNHINVSRGVIRTCIERQESISAFLDCLSTTLRVLINLTNNGPIVCELFGKLEGCDIVVDIMKNINEFPEEQIFDLRILLLSLLINVCETCEDNRIALVGSIHYLVESYTTAIEDNPKLSSQDKHETERSVTGAYFAILLGLMSKNQNNQSMLLEILPGKSFATLIEIIGGFLIYQRTAGILYKEAYQSCAELIKHLNDIQVLLTNVEANVQ